MRGYTKEERDKIKSERLNQQTTTNQGYTVKCICYNTARDIIVEFQDQYKARVHTSWQKFQDGGILNPYHPKQHGGIKGDKYLSMIDGVFVKEYVSWENMLMRCLDKKEKERDKSVAYKEAVCCKEWLLYENFYEWIHNQENFDKWLNGKFTLDKDILVKGSKFYSPETCCLVPENVNKLFIKHGSARGKYPIGVVYHKASNSFVAQAHDGTGKQVHLGCYDTPEKAFLAYKKYKEALIRQIAREEYDKRNITRKCYEAMMQYKVEITD